MAFIKERREMSAFSNELKLAKARYSFADDGGLQSVIDMLDVKGPIVIHQAYVKTIAAVTSAGAPTVEVGIKGGDTDAIMPATVKANLTDNDIIDGASASDRLLVADGAVISMEIKVADLTAGILELVVEYSKF